MKKIMKCRLEAEIIAYRRSEDMDVRFPDGVVVKNVGYGNFKRGMVGHPKAGVFFVKKRKIKSIF